MLVGIQRHSGCWLVHGLRRPGDGLETAQDQHSAVCPDWAGRLVSSAMARTGRTRCLFSATSAYCLRPGSVAVLSRTTRKANRSTGNKPSDSMASVNLAIDTTPTFACEPVLESRGSPASIGPDLSKTEARTIRSPPECPAVGLG